jgi:hypothetical protein
MTSNSLLQDPIPVRVPGERTLTFPYGQRRKASTGQVRRMLRFVRVLLCGLTERYYSAGPD